MKLRSLLLMFAVLITATLFGQTAGKYKRDYTYGITIDRMQVLKAFHPPLFSPSTGTWDDADAPLKTGTIISNTDDGYKPYYWNGTAWVIMGGGSVPTLQQVNDAGNQTTTNMIVKDAFDLSSATVVEYDGLRLSQPLSSLWGYIKRNTLTANRTWLFPDKSGTVAMTSDIPAGISGLTSNYIPVATSSTTLGNSIMYQLSGLRIGIGTTSPQTTFHVLNGGNADIGWFGNSTGTAILGHNSSGGYLNSNASNKGFGLYNGNGTGYVWVNGSTDRVGINTVSPGTTFDVNGTANFSTSAASPKFYVNSTTDWLGWDASNTRSILNSNQLHFRATNPVGTISFETNAGTFATFAPTGRLGIWTSSPVAPIDVTTNNVGVPAGVVYSNGIVLNNTTAATSGSQQGSPALRFHGSGWKTSGTAAAQDVDFQIYNSPIQGTTAPGGMLNFISVINGTTSKNIISFGDQGQIWDGTTFGTSGDVWTSQGNSARAHWATLALGAANGLNISGTNHELGGTLNKNTFIDLNGKYLQFGNNSNSLGLGLLGHGRSSLGDIQNDGNSTALFIDDDNIDITANSQGAIRMNSYGGYFSAGDVDDNVAQAKLLIDPNNNLGNGDQTKLMHAPYNMIKFEDGEANWKIGDAESNSDGWYWGMNSGNLYVKDVNYPSPGDALTMINNSTGLLGWQPNLTFQLHKNNTDLYAKNGVIYVKDSAGNNTVISPHPNGTKNWTYQSTDASGVTTTIDMIKAIEMIEQLRKEVDRLKGKKKTTSVKLIKRTTAKK